MHHCILQDKKTTSMELEKKYQDSGSEDSDEKLGISYSAIKLLQKKIIFTMKWKGIEKFERKEIIS